MRNYKMFALMLVSCVMLAGCADSNTLKDAQTQSDTVAESAAATEDNKSNLETIETVPQSELNPAFDHVYANLYESALFSINYAPGYIGKCIFTYHNYAFGKDDYYKSLVISVYKDVNDLEENSDLSAIKTSADVINQMFDQGVVIALSNMYMLESFTIDSEETVMVNGIETTKHKGTASVHYNVSGKEVGEFKYVSYSMIVETGRPYFFIVFDKTEDGSLIGELEEYLDVVMPTFKDKGKTDGILPESN